MFHLRLFAHYFTLKLTTVVLCTSYLNKLQQLECLIKIFGKLMLLHSNKACAFFFNKVFLNKPPDVIFGRYVNCIEKTKI